MSLTRQLGDNAAAARAEQQWSDHLAGCAMCQRHVSAPERSKALNKCTVGRNLLDELIRLRIWGSGISS